MASRNIHCLPGRVAALCLVGLLLTACQPDTLLPVSQPASTGVQPDRLISTSIPTSALAATATLPAPTLPVRLPPITETSALPLVSATQAVDHPDSTVITQSVEIIGYSVAHRPLEVYRFGTGDRQRMIVAGIHGGYEWNTGALARQLIEHLRQNPQLVPPSVTLYILPRLNPDGEARSTGYAGRANENGVDLNRNFPANWQSDWDRFGCWNHLPTTGGSHPLSEPETYALALFILSHPLDALISYHSAALGIFPGGVPVDPAAENLARALAAVAPYSYPPVDTGCLYTGQFVDWVVQNGIAGVDIELTDHKNTDFEINLLVLETFLNWQYP